jgi:hypothetical protein
MRDFKNPVHMELQMRIFLAVQLLACLIGFTEASAQYRNYEASPNGSGGIQGTYGNQNFDIDGQSYGNASGQVGGERPGVRQVRPSQTPGNFGATQRRCFVGENGNTFCQ